MYVNPFFFKCGKYRYFFCQAGQDGLGAQIFRQMQVKVFCYEEKNNCKYVFKPSPSMHHNYKNDPNYKYFTEHFFNLWDDAYHFEQIDGICPIKSHVQYPYPYYLMQKYGGRLRESYDKGVNVPALIDENDFNCVVYLRRGKRKKSSKTNKHSVS